MSNTILNPSIIAKEALRQLKNNCVMGNLVFRGYEEEFVTNSRGWKVGSSVTVKAPVQFRTHHARDISAAKVDLLEQSTTFTVDRWVGVAWTLNAEEMTFNIDKFSQRFLKPAMQAIANDIDSYLLGLYYAIPNQVGTPGTTPDNLLTYLQAHARLTDHAAPMDDRHCVINPTAKVYLADHLKGLFNQSMVGSAVERAQIPNIAGFNMYESQNVQNHTCGTAAGVSLAVDDVQCAEGATGFTIDNGAGDWTTTLTAGDILTAGNSYAVNPISGSNLGYLRQFAVTTAVDTSGTEATILSNPGTAPFPIYSSSATSKYLPYQTVTTLPTVDQTVTVSGSASLVHPVNLAFHRDCLGLVMVPIEIPASFTWKAVESYDGYTISVTRYPTGDTLTETIRLDAILGRKVLNPFLGCRIAG